MKLLVGSVNKYRKPQPQSGPKEMERLIRRDLKDMNLDEDEWYNKATTSRHGGHLVVLVLRTTENNLYNNQSIPVVRQVTCEVCMQNVS